MATVLALVGDEVSLLNLQEILETFGHALVGVSDPDEVLGQVANRAFDLHLIDIHIDKMDPVALVRRILESRPDARIAAIAAHPKDALTKAVVEAGAQTLMRKPYEVGQILHLLDRTGNENRS